MAGREGMTRRLLSIGIQSMSVSPRLIPQVRREMAYFVVDKANILRKAT